MLGHMIRIAVHHTSRLPAHKMTLRVFAEAVNAIQIDAPFCASLDRLFADGFQRNARRCIPHVSFFVDAAQALPAGIPVSGRFVCPQIDIQVNPIAGRSNLKFLVPLDVGPIVAEKKFDHVTVPELEAIFAVIGRQPEIQFRVGRDEEKIEIGVRPKRANFSFEFGVVKLPGTVFFNPSRCGVLPRLRPRIGVQLRRFRNVRNGKVRRGHCHFTHFCSGVALRGLRRATRSRQTVADRNGRDANEHNYD